AGAGRLQAALAQSAEEDGLRALARQLSAQERDGLCGGGVVLQTLRKLEEDAAAFSAELLGRPQPDPGARVRAGRAERLDGPWLSRKLTGQEEQVLTPHPGLGVAMGVVGQALQDVHRLSEPLADVDKKRQKEQNHLVGELRQQYAGGDLQPALLVRADHPIAHFRIEQREYVPLGAFDEERAVKRGITDLDLWRPPEERLAADAHGVETRRHRTPDEDPGF